MPKYRALRDTLLAHECRVVKEGEEFVTTFPPAKDAQGNEVPMTLGNNLELVEDEAPTTKKGKKADDLT